jgi:hypothetical protein
MRKLLLASTALIALTISSPAMADAVLTAHATTAYLLEINRPFELGDRLLVDPGFPFNTSPNIELGQNGAVRYEQTARYAIFGAGFSGEGFSASVGFFADLLGASVDLVGFEGPVQFLLIGRSTGVLLVDQWIDTSIACRDALVCSASSPSPEFVTLSLLTDDGAGSLVRLGAVPELSTWIMMIIGFIGLGGTAKFRSRCLAASRF